jgi:hypothetical protein
MRVPLKHGNIAHDANDVLVSVKLTVVENCSKIPYCNPKMKILLILFQHYCYSVTFFIIELQESF